MPDEAAAPPYALSATGILSAIDALRNETREARHAQANATQVAIAGLRSEMDARLRAIEKTLDTSNPVSLGPRLNDLERWQSRADADAQGGLPVRIASVEQKLDEMRGAVQAARILALGLGILSAALGVVAFMQPNP